MHQTRRHFFANTRNKLYAFYMGKGGLLKKKIELMGRAVAPTAPFPCESTTGVLPFVHHGVLMYMGCSGVSELGARLRSHVVRQLCSV